MYQHELDHQLENSSAGMDLGILLGTSYAGAIDVSSWQQPKLHQAKLGSEDHEEAMLLQLGSPGQGTEMLG